MLYPFVMTGFDIEGKQPLKTVKDLLKLVIESN